MIVVSQNSFVSEVIESPHVVIAYFWAPWCGLCNFIEPLIMQLPKKFAKELKLVSINADANFKLANNYRIKSLPTLIIFNQGQVAQRIESFHDRDSLFQVLEKSLSCGQE
ncbi:MAG: thioredoxin [Synechococcaceae cyanobacterium RL_1_2]|nr:thioredoxin [Synechococcaceae cyanobacterium RL_1_2]